MWNAVDSRYFVRWGRPGSSSSVGDGGLSFLAAWLRHGAVFLLFALIYDVPSFKPHFAIGGHALDHKRLELMHELPIKTDSKS